MKATDIKERPILFSGPMIRAILEGRKTQTRRVLLPTDIPAATRSLRWENQTAEELLHVAHCKYGQPGDRLWVREAFYVDTTPVGQLPVTPTRDDIDNTYYRANGECCDQIPECCCAEVGKPKWRSPIHMPRWASRILLEITAVRVQRLQDISEDDAIAEGLLAQAGDGTGPGAGYKWNGIGYHGAGFGRYGPTFHVSGPQSKKCICNVGGPTPAQCAFRELWDSINGKRSPWSANDWVWALTFKRLEQP